MIEKTPQTSNLCTKSNVWRINVNKFGNSVHQDLPKMSPHPCQCGNPTHISCLEICKISHQHVKLGGKFIHVAKLKLLYQK